MRFSIEMSNIAKSVKAAAAFASTSSEVPELQCLRIEAIAASFDGPPKVVLNAFNAISWCELLVLGAEVHEEGVTLVNAADLRRWLQASPTHWPLDFSATSDQVILRAGSSTYRMDVRDPMKFPSPKPPANAEYTRLRIPCQIISKALGSVMFASDKKDVGLIKTDVVLFDISDKKIGFMSTDTKVLSVVEIEAMVSGKPIAELLPAPALQAMMPLLGDGGDAVINVSKYDAQIAIDRLIFGTKLVMSQKLPWRQVLKEWDKDRPEKITILQHDFLAAVRQVASTSPDKLRMEVEAIPGQGIRLECPGKGHAEITMPCSHAMKFAMSWDYLIDLFAAACRASDPVTLEWGKVDCSVIFRVGPDWRYAAVVLEKGGTG